jgi:hypothetical protein
MRRVGLVIAVVGALLVLVACGGPAAVPEASTSVPPSPDLRPTQASSQGPARNLPRPVLPESAKQNTKEGFEAFTQYWFDVASYALENNEPDAIKNLSKPDCKVCNAYIEDSVETASSGGWWEGPRWRVSGFLADMTLDPLKQALGQFLLDESPSSKFDSGGNVLKSMKGGNNNRLKEIYAVYQDGRWLAAQLGQA